jgi:DNA-binding MarR family transcriptional regulator
MPRRPASPRASTAPVPEFAAPIPELAALDAGLMRLRRLWTAPRTHDGMRADLGDGVELSTVLVVDAIAGARGPCGVVEVAERVDVAPSTASRLVERAVQAGMVERQPSPSDGRRAALQLTTRGQALHEAACAFRVGYLGRILDGWAPDAVAELARGITALADAVAAAPPPDPPQLDHP